MSYKLTASLAFFLLLNTLYASTTTTTQDPFKEVVSGTLSKDIEQVPLGSPTMWESFSSAFGNLFKTEPLSTSKTEPGIGGTQKSASKDTPIQPPPVTRFDVTQAQGLDLITSYTTHIGTQQKQHNDAILATEIGPNNTRIITNNVNLFRGASDKPQGNSFDTLTSELKSLSPNILMLQEVPTKSTEQTTYDKLLQISKDELSLPNIVNCARDDSSSLVIASKYTFNDNYKFMDTEKKFCYGLMAKITVAGREITIVNVHLSKDGNIADKQLQDILAAIKGIQYVVLAGDFNQVKGGKTLELLTPTNFVNVFDARKWNQPPFSCQSGLTVDFIFVSSTLASLVDYPFQWLTTNSNHTPICTDIIIKESVYYKVTSWFNVKIAPQQSNQPPTTSTTSTTDQSKISTGVVVVIIIAVAMTGLYIVM